MQAQAVGGGEGGLLQNPKVQIGLIVGGAVALIAVALMLFLPNMGGGDSAPSVPTGQMPGMAESGGAPSMPGAPAANGPGGSPMAGAAPAMPGGAPSPGGMPGMGAMPAAAGTPGAAPGPGQAAEQARPQTPGVPTRRDPFSPTRELTEVIKSIPEDPKVPDALSPAHEIYAELNPPKPPVSVSEDDGDGPPIPPMRVAAFVEGAQLSAMLQIGNPPGARFEMVTPGKSVQYLGQTYKVERLEHNRVVLANNWEIGQRTGVQRIEVGLSGGARAGELAE
jgi:hypothetical protein